MRILRFIRSIDPAGGGPIEALKRLSLALREDGHDVEVASLDSAHAECLVNFPLKHHPLGRRREGYGFNGGVVEWLQSRAGDFDAVIVHGLWQYHSLAAWRALRGAQTPYFVYPHGMLDPWFKKAHPLKHLKKWLYWPWAEYRVLRDARAVLFTCETERQLARESFWLYRCREEVVNYGTSVPTENSLAQQAAFHRAQPRLANQPFLLFLGRVHEKKGVDLLLRAFASLRQSGLYRNHFLVIAGPGPARLLEEFQQLGRSLGLADRVVWTGMLEGDLKWGAMRSASAFVLPSHQENFGVAVAEALGCGLPVLISEKVNIWPEVVAAGAGFSAADDLAGTTKLLADWHACSEKEIISQRARDLFNHRYDIGRVAESFIETLKRCGVSA